MSRNFNPKLLFPISKGLIMRRTPSANSPVFKIPLDLSTVPARETIIVGLEGPMSGKPKPSKSSSTSSTPHPASPGQSVEESLIGSGTDISSSSRSKTQKLCGVCNDRAKSFHFGGLACDSCKAFFRRSVHNEAYASFQCSYESTCLVTKHTRKGCQKCRFEKCINIGMEKKWVMSEQERNALNKQRQERKTKEPPSPSQSTSRESAAGSQRSSQVTSPIEYIPDVDDMLSYMTLEEQECIQKIVEDYRAAYVEIPYEVPQVEGQRNSLEVVEMFTTILRRFAYFSNLVPEFNRLGKPDQGNLLRASVLEMCLLRGALSFDIENHRWPNTSLEFLKSCPKLRVEDMENLVSRELYEMHMRFIFNMQKMQVDEPTIMLLLLVVLFYPERSVVTDVESVESAQEKYLLLLEKYVHWRYGPRRASLLYPQLLTKLTDLRQLNDLHTEYNLKLAESDVNTIRQNLQKLKLDPYPQWKIVSNDPEEPPLEEMSNPQPTPRQSSPLFPPPPAETASRSPPTFTPRPGGRLLADEFLKRIPTLLEDPLAPMFSPADMEKAQAYFEGPQAAQMREFFSNRSLHSRRASQGPSSQGTSASVYPTEYPYAQMGSDRSQSTTESLTTKTYTVIQPTRNLYGGMVSASARRESQSTAVSTEEIVSSALSREEGDGRGQEGYQRAQFKRYAQSSREMVEVEENIEESEQGQSQLGAAAGRGGWPATSSWSGGNIQSPTRRQQLYQMGYQEENPSTSPPNPRPDYPWN